LNVERLAQGVIAVESETIAGDGRFERLPNGSKAPWSAFLAGHRSAAKSGTT
jgi:hypothetical protein